ncbi:5-hydroxytryptamine receptor 3A-like [Chelmon rostratus]|uniref:5-hydroxytryptamine receptor 3A-like n=1 Tax=Chelmon rostratus TaxID=109905 RepID=UPI001BE73B75|nr:5-hydroxytryptamine receptor 3A-like [Chelmon rostratus]
MSALRVLAFLAFAAGVSGGQTSDCSYLTLLKHLNLTATNDVLAIMRPVRNWTTSTVVLVDMVLFGILEVDEKSQTLTSHVWFQMSWTNEFLTWKPSDFCGINRLTVPRSRLWIPDVTIQEDASDTGSILKGPLATVIPSGWMFVGARQRLTVTCQLQLFLFPFDVQRCNITFRSMSSEVETINVLPLNNDTTLTKVSEQIMVTQGEWQLENIEIINHDIPKTGSGQSTLIYTVTISRRPMLYVIILIVPLFYLLVLDLASFFISDGSGEKLSFKVTVLLSISVLLLILQDMLPSTEEKLPMMATYCITIFALVGISLLEAMLVSFLNDLGGDCGQKAQRSVDVEIQLEADCHKEPAAAEEEAQVEAEKSDRPLEGRSGHELLKLILEEVKAARQEAEAQEKGKRKAEYYRRVAKTIDSVFFVLYFLTVVIVLMFMGRVWVTNYPE